MLTLENFEDEIDSTILERGDEYWRRGLVLDIKNIDENITALVKGTDIYEVKTRLAGKGILNSRCNCPYEGDYCKHEVAVFYALSRGNKLSKKQTNDTTNLNKMSKKELIELVQKGRETNLDFDNLYETQTEFKNKDSKKDDYKRLIRQSINNAKDRGGFIDYWHADRAARGAENLLDLTETLNNKDIQKQIDIYQAVIETLVPILQYADDSNGAIGECIEYAMEKLTKLSDKIKDNKLKSNLFNYCLKEHLKKKYDGWDWAMRFLEIAGNITNIKQKEKFYSALKKYINTEDDLRRDYEAEKAAVIKLNTIKRLEGIKKAEQFIQNNLKFSDIREIATRDAIDKGNLSKAKNLAHEGCKLHQQYPGIVHKYLDYLLKIAKKENDHDKQKEILAKLFFIGPSREFEFYDKLKKICNEKEWTKILVKIISKIECDYDLAKIYYKEKMWPELLSIAKEPGEPYIVEEYFSKLYKLYPKELAKIYEKVIYNKMEYAGGRSLYQEVVKYIERIIFIGDKQKAKLIVDNLKVKYKNRRAMIEELNQINFQNK